MQRYGFGTRDIYPSENGDWVRFSDAKQLLDAAQAVVDAANYVMLKEASGSSLDALYLAIERHEEVQNGLR